VPTWMLMPCCVPTNQQNLLREQNFRKKAARTIQYNSP
jgi:hypothetical protein